MRFYNTVPTVRLVSVVVLLPMTLFWVNRLLDRTKLDSKSKHRKLTSFRTNAQTFFLLLLSLCAQSMQGTAKCLTQFR
ncbi:hypothetical protein GGR51DRAFT_522996 [Nemania sp. FL0031]|nr:hypothetical protein GGR51DRAFT_522996 [Nemania sp. FL0031]